MLTLNEIRNVNFRKSNFGGYRAEDVEAFIDEVQLSYDTLLKENAELVKKLEVLASKLEEYQNEEDSIRNALMNAQKVGDSSLRDAKHKAEIILKDATIKAEKIVASAQSEIHNERDIIERMQRDIADFKTKLLRAYKDHLTLINNIPNEEILRPETGKMVDSVQMLDRRGVMAGYAEPPQPFAENSRPMQPPPPQGEAEPFAPPLSEPQDMVDERAPQAPVMPMADRNIRRGGFTVSVGENDLPPGPESPAQLRRNPRFSPSFGDDMEAGSEPDRFEDMRMDPREEKAGGDGAPPNAPGNLFRRRGSGNIQ